MLPLLCKAVPDFYMLCPDNCLLIDFIDEKYSFQTIVPQTTLMSHFLFSLRIANLLTQSPIIGNLKSLPWRTILIKTTQQIKAVSSKA